MPDDNLGYLFAAFAVTWAVFFLYIFFVARKQQDIDRELQTVRQSLEGQEHSLDPDRR